MAAKILVVDDDPNVQRLLGYTLKQEGYEVVVASDGAEGFRLWSDEVPALVLLDVMLPKLDGYQVAAKIRAEEGSASHVPIIMLTAEAEVEQKIRGLRAGADDYLVKPFHPAELLARIRSLLARFAPKDVTVGHPPLGRVLAFYGAKGGVGTTTIAINVAIALHKELGRKVCLVDANLQFGDHRVFMDLGLDRKSIVDVANAPSIDADLLRGILVEHESEVDLLLAPPSPEMAELVTKEHVAHTIEALRGMYDYVVVDVDKRLDDLNLGVFDAAEFLFVVLTADLSCLKNVRLVLETLGHIGYANDRDQAPPEPLERLHRDQREDGGGGAQAPDRPPGPQRVPRGDQRPQLGRPGHADEGRFAARPLAPRRGPGDRQGRRRGRRDRPRALTAPPTLARGGAAVPRGPRGKRPIRSG